jgi:hypothetical protein
MAVRDLARQLSSYPLLWLLGGGPAVRADEQELFVPFSPRLDVFPGSLVPSAPHAGDRGPSRLEQLYVELEDPPGSMVPLAEKPQRKRGCNPKLSLSPSA